jgi:trimeric autotransporter adhesin
MAYQPKSYRKFLAGSVSAALVASAIGPVAANAAGFSDVSEDNVHYEGIMALTEKGLLKGYEDGTFKPAQKITRGQVAKIMARLIEGEGELEQVFDDVPVTADEELVRAAHEVFNAGVFTGNNGNLKPADNITRQQMAKVLVEAFDLEHSDKYENNLTDLDTAYEEYREYIQILVENGITQVADGKFRPLEHVSRAQFATFVYRILNATAEEEVTAADIEAVTFVDENTLEVTFNGTLTEVNKEDFSIEGVEIESVEIKASAAEEAAKTVVVIKTKTKLEEGKSYTVAYKGETTEKTKVEVPVVTPAVESVSAINLTQYVVKFNKEVEKTSAEDKTNYTFDNAALGASNKVELNADGKSVTVTLANKVDNQSVKSVTVKNVKDVNGKAITEFKGEVKFEDFTVPTVTSVTSAGPSKFKVTFSEPVDTTTAENIANYSVNNGQYFIKSATKTGLNEVVVDLYSTLTAGEYEVKIANVKDLAGYKISDTTLKLVQVEDKDAPTVAKVVSATPTEVVLEMSEDVTATGTSIKDSIYHTNSSNKASDVKVEGKKVTITFSEANKLPNGTAYLYIGKDLFVDGWGNKNAEYNTSLNVVADTVKPTVEKVEATADNTIKVTFSEKVNEASAETAGNYTILDNTGKKVDVTINPVLDATAKVVTLNLSKSLTGGIYTVAIENVKDLANNTIDKVTANVAVKDTTPPTVTATGTKYSDKKIVKISFDEPMATTGTGSVLDLANYSIGGKYLNTTKAKISLTDEGKAVLIDLTDAIAAGELSGMPTSVTVGKVADVSGNFTSAFSNDVTLSEASEFGISKVEAVDTKTVKVYLEDALSKFEADDFVLKAGSTTITPASVVFANVDGKGVITYTLADADKLGTDGKKGTDSITVETVADASTINSANAFGVKVKAGHAPVPATDKIVATLEKFNHDSDDSTADVEDVKLTFTDTDGDGKIDKSETATIKLKFSEAMDASTISKLTFEVAGFTVTNVALDTTDTSVIVITATANEDNTDPKPTVKQVANIADLNGVVVAGGSSWKVAKVN